MLHHFRAQFSDFWNRNFIECNRGSVASEKILEEMREKKYHTVKYWAQKWGFVYAFT